MAVNTPAPEHPGGAVRHLISVMATAMMENQQVAATFLGDTLELAPETHALLRGEHATAADHTNMCHMVRGSG